MDNIIQMNIILHLIKKLATTPYPCTENLSKQALKHLHRHMAKTIRDTELCHHKLLSTISN